MSQSRVTSASRWALLLALVVAVAWAWQSGATDELTLGNLKARQSELLAWVDTNMSRSRRRRSPARR